MGNPSGSDRERKGRRKRLPARRRGSPEVLVTTGHQHRGEQVLPGRAGLPRPREQRPPADRSRGVQDRRLGGRHGVFRPRGKPPGVHRRPQAPARAPARRVQQPRLVQLRIREKTAMLRVLHQLGGRHDGVHPRVGENRRNAVQVRVRNRIEPLIHQIVARGAQRRWDCIRPCLVHEGVRRIRRRDQVGRKDPAGRQDGDSQCGPPRHRRVHQLQGRRGAQGMGPD